MSRPYILTVTLVKGWPALCQDSRNSTIVSLVIAWIIINMNAIYTRIRLELENT